MTNRAIEEVLVALQSVNNPTYKQYIDVLKNIINDISAELQSKNKSRDKVASEQAYEQAILCVRFFLPVLEEGQEDVIKSLSDRVGIHLKDEYLSISKKNTRPPARNPYGPLLSAEINHWMNESRPSNYKAVDYDMAKNFALVLSKVAAESSLSDFQKATLAKTMHVNMLAKVERIEAGAGQSLRACRNLFNGIKNSQEQYIETTKAENSSEADQTLNSALQIKLEEQIRNLQLLENIIKTIQADETKINLWNQFCITNRFSESFKNNYRSYVKEYTDDLQLLVDIRNTLHENPAQPDLIRNYETNINNLGIKYKDGVSGWVHNTSNCLIFINNTIDKLKAKHQQSINDLNRDINATDMESKAQYVNNESKKLGDQVVKRYSEQYGDVIEQELNSHSLDKLVPKPFGLGIPLIGSLVNLITGYSKKLNDTKLAKELLMKTHSAEQITTKDESKFKDNDLVTIKINPSELRTSVFAKVNCSRFNQCLDNYSLAVVAKQRLQDEKEKIKENGTALVQLESQLNIGTITQALHLNYILAPHLNHNLNMAR